MNNLPGKKTIIASCRSTDLKNEHIRRLIGILCAILLGIGVGYHTAQLLNLSVPEIPMWIGVALVAAALLFCVQQMLMQPVHITFFPEQGEDIVLMNNHFYWVADSAGSNCSYTLIFDKDFKIKKLSCEGQTVYRISGRPSKQMIDMFRKSECVERECPHPYHFKIISLAIQPSKAEDAEIQRHLLLRKLTTFSVPKES